MDHQAGARPANGYLGCDHPPSIRPPATEPARLQREQVVGAAAGPAHPSSLHASSDHDVLMLFDHSGADDVHAPAPQITRQAVATEQMWSRALEVAR